MWPLLPPGSGDPAIDITVPSTLEQPPVPSASSLEAGSRAAQQGALPVASSATRERQDGPEAQQITDTVLPAPWMLTSGKSLPPPSVYADGSVDDLHQGRSPVGNELVPTLPVDHVGVHPVSLRASGGLSGSSHFSVQLTSADFRFTVCPLHFSSLRTRLYQPRGH